MSNIYRGPSIDASYQVSVHMAEGFQRRRLKCEKLTDDGRQTTDAKRWQRLTLPLARWAKNGGPRSGLTCRASPWWKFEYFLPYFPNKFWTVNNRPISDNGFCKQYLFYYLFWSSCTIGFGQVKTMSLLDEMFSKSQSIFAMIDP